MQYGGEIEIPVDAARMADGSWLDKNSGSLIPPEQQGRIEIAATHTREQRGWDITPERRFFPINSFHPTDLRKEPPGGVVNHRYPDLAETPDTEQPPDIEEIARRLSEETW